MSKKRGNGDGSVYYSESRKQWICQITVGRTVEGKVKRRAIYGKTRKEVVEKMVQIQNELHNGIYVEPSKMKMGEYLRQLIDEDKALNLISEVSYLRKVESFKLIERDRISAIPLQNVTEQQLKAFLTSITHYSNSVISKVYGLLSRCFREALKSNLIFKNPMLNVRKPKSDKPNRKIRALTLTEQQALIEVLKNTNVKYKDQILLMMLTGMRMGEINALTPADIDLTFKTINVNRTITKNSADKAIIGITTKTYSGSRKIPMSEPVLKIMTRLCHEHKGSRNDLIFTSDRNCPLTTSQVNSAFNRLLESHNIADEDVSGTLSLHSLRHTFATRSIEAGMPAKVLQVILGHADIKITMNTYCDAFSEYQELHMNQVEQYFKENRLIV